MDKPITLIYINANATMYYNNKKFKKLINKKLETRKWVVCNNDLRFIPEEMGDIINPDFFNGMAAAQYQEIQKGGTFINPYLLGLSNSFEIWSSFIWATHNFNQTILYLDISFEEYETFIDDYWGVNKEIYEKNSEATKKLVKLLKDAIMENEVIH